MGWVDKPNWLCPSPRPRPVLRRGQLLSGAAPVLHLPLLREDGLHRDLPAGARLLRARRNLHRSGEDSGLSYTLTPQSPFFLPLKLVLSV